MVEIGENQLGIIVDSVQDVMRVSSQTISPPPKMIVTRADARFITGICKLPNQLIMLLDLGKVLKDEELEQVVDASMVRDINGAFQAAL